MAHSEMRYLAGRPFASKVAMERFMRSELIQAHAAHPNGIIETDSRLGLLLAELIRYDSRASLIFGAGVARYIVAVRTKASGEVKSYIVELTREDLSRQVLSMRRLIDQVFARDGHDYEREHRQWVCEAMWNMANIQQMDFARARSRELGVELTETDGLRYIGSDFSQLCEDYAKHVGGWDKIRVRENIAKGRVYLVAPHAAGWLDHHGEHAQMELVMDTDEAEDGQ